MDSIHILMDLVHRGGPCPSGGGGDTHMKGAGMLVVPLSDVKISDFVLA